MRFRRLVAVSAAVVTLAGVATAAAVTAPAAHAATQPEICHNFNNLSDCWNNWNAANAAVKIAGAGFTNDAFDLELINPCNSNPPDTVTPTCPFTVGSGMNNRYLGNWIFRVRDVNSRFCVGTNTNGNASEGGCGNANASGSANGVIMIQGNGAFYYVNRFWSNQRGFPVGAVDPECAGCAIPLDSLADAGLTAWSQGFV